MCLVLFQQPSRQRIMGLHDFTSEQCTNDSYNRATRWLITVFPSIMVSMGMGPCHGPDPGVIPGGRDDTLPLFFGFTRERRYTSPFFFGFTPQEKVHQNAGRNTKPRSRGARCLSPRGQRRSVTGSLIAPGAMASRAAALARAQLFFTCQIRSPQLRAFC